MSLKTYLLVQPHSLVCSNVIAHLVDSGFKQMGVVAGTGTCVMVAINPERNLKEVWEHNGVYCRDEAVAVYTNIAAFLGDVMRYSDLDVKIVVNEQKYTAVFGKGFVQFGCATISNTLIRDAFKLFEINDTSSTGRNVTSVKIGKGEFTKELLAQIINHPSFKD